MNWSAQQNEIFEWFSDNRYEDSNLVVTARAGTGKTTTITEGVKRAFDNNIVVCAFNKGIERELNLRLNGQPNAKSKTLHGLGFGSVMRYWRGVPLDTNQSRPGKPNRADFLAQSVCGIRVPEHIQRLVAKLHTKGREIKPHARRAGDLLDLAYQFECDPDESWIDDGWDVGMVELYALQAMELAATVKPINGIDFSDMIFLPCRNHWLRPTYDLVVVDEAQDMTSAQLEIAQGLCRGRIAIVGDDRQAIYGFRGADSNSMSRLKRELDAEQRTLNVTYRCGIQIVEYAAALVPDFTAGPNNPEGEIIPLPQDKLIATAEHGDFILSRVNAPLVSTAMSLLKSGKRARIAGRDIGAGLKALLKKLKARSIPDMLSRIQAWETKQTRRYEKAERPEKIAQIKDQAEMLTELVASCASVDDVNDKIDALFTDDGLGQMGIITCSSVHKAKGLEATRVFLLEDTFRGGSREEDNIRYVAITRAKQTLFLVKGAEA